MKVLIADDHALFRDGLGMRLEQIDPNVVILQASSFGQALKILDQEKKIDLVVLDLDMPDMPWEEGLGEMRKRPNAPALSWSRLPKTCATSARCLKAVSAAIFPNVLIRKF